MKQRIIWLQLFSEAAPGESSADAGRGAETEGKEAALDREEQSAAQMTWEQVKAHPEFSQKMQEMVKSRLKNAKSAQENLEKLSPALKTLSAAYGLADPGDLAGLNQAILSDKRFAPKDPIESHFASLQQQAEAFAASVPDFDLGRELENPAFVRLTAPNVGISLEDAYYTVHRQEQEAKTAAQIANAIRAGALRPEENGVGAPAMTVFDYRNASREQRNALKKQIRLAAAKGEKIYP